MISFCSNLYSVILRALAPFQVHTQLLLLITSTRIIHIMQNGITPTVKAPPIHLLNYSWKQEEHSAELRFQECLIVSPALIRGQESLLGRISGRE